MHGHRQSGGASLSALITTLSALSAAVGGWCPAAAADDGRGGECQPHWAPTFGAAPGVDDRVTSLQTFDAGNGEALYAAGWFTTAGGISVGHVARWDGSAWSRLGSGLNNTVDALAVFDDGNGPDLYAGGIFTNAGGQTANRIARWDGSGWSSLGSGMNNRVTALAVFDDGNGPALYAGGLFTTAGGAPASRIAKWNGSSWSPLGSGLNNSVHSLAVYDDGTGPALYVGGKFTTAGGAPASNIAKWDGSSWSPVGGGVSGSGNSVFAMTVYDDGTGPALYAGGTITVAGGMSVGRIAKWDGTSWSPLGDGLNNYVASLGVYADADGTGQALYVGGNFTTAGGEMVNRMARWDGAEWSGVGDACPGTWQDGCGMNPTGIVWAMDVFDDGSGDGPSLFVGGAFERSGGIVTRRMAKWNPGSANLRAGGAGATGTLSGRETMRSSARGGGEWSALGTGLDDNVMTLYRSPSGDLYAGGLFTTAGGQEVNGIARWVSDEGGSWQVIGGGMNERVFAITEFDDGSGQGLELYAGGRFTMAGDVEASYIAKWDAATQTWVPVGGGMSGNANGAPPSVRAFAIYDDGSGPALYAGGDFAMAGGVTVNSIAKWDGESWAAVGTGIDGAGGAGIQTMAVFEDGPRPSLYVGGNLHSAGGSPAQHIAKWDGLNWSGVGGGMPSIVQSLIVYDEGDGEALYAAGGFWEAGGQDIQRVARWDGTTWSPLGAGIGCGVGGCIQIVRALAVFDDGTGPALYAGGQFPAVNGMSTPAANIGRWNGTAWEPVGSGLNGTVYALAVHDNGVVAGGAFTSAFDSDDSFIAKWQGCLEITEGDLNGDSVVDVSDLLILLSAWGNCNDAGNCPADLSGDGVVDVTDLLTLLANWG